MHMVCIPMGGYSNNLLGSAVSSMCIGVHVYKLYTVVIFGPQKKVKSSENSLVTSASMMIYFHIRGRIIIVYVMWKTWIVRFFMPSSTLDVQRRH